MELENRTPEQIEEAHKLNDVVHAQHGLVIDYLANEFNTTFKDLQDDTSNSIRKRLSDLNEYYKELLPSKGFWGRVCSRQLATIKRLERELEQQKFNNKNNLSIDQQISDEMDRLKKENDELREYKWKYEDLCK